jgi:membrane protein DedA with SNARE-associated domain
MNPFLLWVPGVALIVLGAVLLATGTMDTTTALLLIGIGVMIESAGVVLWLRDRSRRSPRPR